MSSKESVLWSDSKAVYIFLYLLVIVLSKCIHLELFVLLKSASWAIKRNKNKNKIDVKFWSYNELLNKTVSMIMSSYSDSILSIKCIFCNKWNRFGSWNATKVNETVVVVGGYTFCFCSKKTSKLELSVDMYWAQTTVCDVSPKKPKKYRTIFRKQFRSNLFFRYLVASPIVSSFLNSVNDRCWLNSWHLCTP